ncbi:MAG: hypothetical protein WCK05_13220 [Planctomycetota bacterium]
MNRDRGRRACNHGMGIPRTLSDRLSGRLFEAEDESQAWPDLHYAIRKAWKTYQQTGKVPDYEALAATVAGHCSG